MATQQCAPGKHTLPLRVFTFVVMMAMCGANVNNGDPITVTSRVERMPRAWLDGCPDGPHSAITALLFKSINLSYPGLENARAAFAKNNLTGACNEVAQYYADASTAGWLRKAGPQPGKTLVGGEIDSIVFNDTYDFYGEVGRVPRNTDGGLDWYFQGPVNDDEFMHALNRFEWWPQLLDAWLQTGNPVYAKFFNAQAGDWTLHNLPAPNVKRLGNYTWHTLDSGIRASTTWPQAFFGFQNTADVKGSTRCAIVACLAEHGRYLNLYASTGNSNWRSMQYNGLGLIALTLPELVHADEWYANAEAAIVADMENGVYPDGVEDEETSGYHKVALLNFQAQRDAVVASGRTPDPRMDAIIERMHGYLAYSLDAAGYSPLNSDSDTTYNAPFIAAAAITYKRPDWAYIASNGVNGTVPDGPPSTMFPWGGQLVSRSGWDRGAQWSWFDVGPFGSSSHGHRDRTHLSIRIGAVQILVDSGRFAYAGDYAQYRTNYGVLSSGHNVLLIDGKQQVDTPPKALAPLSNDTWSITTDEDRARASVEFDGIVGDATHTRSLVYVRGKFWLAVDRIDSNRPRSIEALWHAHPNCTVVLDSSAGSAHIVDNSSRVGVDIVQASGASAVWSNVEVIIGQTTPVLQGWYSPHYDAFSASPAISLTSEIEAGASTFAWLIVPTEGGVASSATAHIVSANATHVCVAVLVGGETSTMTVEV